MTIRYVESSKLPTPWGMFAMHGFEDTESGKEHLVLTMGDMDTGEPLLARIHSECLTGDALFSLRCDCGAQLQHAMHRIAIEGRGAIFYLRQEGRGIGLLNKIRAYHLQDCGADTVEANEQLGFGADMRDYSILKSMLEHLGVKSVRLMTNNPRKVKAVEELGIEVVERLPHETGRNPHNVKYLSTKKGKLGHLFEDDQGSPEDE
ncbi:GTP cyclohydrolase II [Microbulbifer rhizosphaerae]|uniref:GTP cyclohydrolase-2 n=1 Tax=Microbulbifer rhizosphaerae TaxID=1562603 RepID=A0A7W4Z7T6_9GAMM|nr:GTP cyclohydrolase II [Microbulbifer rhizosphaerae]MBB3059831.1 GTP cyclohydrolase II [Microbulbifer rhizosphaerae]